MLGGCLAGLAGAYLSIAQAKMFSDTLISGRGFIAVALVYFGHWHPLQIMGGALLFTFAQTFQTIIQRNIRLSEAPSFGKPALLYDASSSGSINYLNLAKEFIKKNRNK